jgi:ubiquinone/menaquinone biosynthesis C-methylase UbiE
LSVEKFKPQERFSNRVSNYIKYRPSYPIETIEILKQETNIDTSKSICDIGSGTGLFTKLLLENGYKVYGVEPNNEMREAGEEYLSKYNKFTSINANAENTTLEDKSIDLITVAQAFHWFDLKKVKIEFCRILKENGYIALIWNDRVLNKDGFQNDYEAFLLKYCPEYKEVSYRNVNEETSIKNFFSPNNVIKKELENYQEFNFEGLKGRLLSSSYSLTQDNEQYTQMLKELEVIFNKYQNNGLIKFEYNTLIYISNLS